MAAGDLNVLEFSGSSPGPRLLITGGVHGDEFEPILAVRELARLLAGPASPLQVGHVSLVPCVNDDAFLRGTRCASDGLDLARTCPGKATGSITERTAWRLSELIRAADYYIDLHTGGTEFSVYPLSGYMLHPKTDVLHAQRQMAAAFGLPVVWGTSHTLDGRSLSVARDASVPAIYCEYLGAAGCSQEGIRAYVEGCLNVMRLLTIAEGQVTVAAPELVEEDPRDDSGHLQRCCPSPADGIFVSHVSLGQEVTAGAVLGTVSCPRDGDSTAIQAPHDGVVIMLRTFPLVRAGESTGVVLERTTET